MKKIINQFYYKTNCQTTHTLNKFSSNIVLYTMSNLFYLTSGIVLGVYLDQKYDLPRVTKTLENIAEYLKTIEKENNDKKN